MKKLLMLFLFSVLAFSAHAQTLNKRIDSVMQLAYRRGIFNGNILIAQKGKIIYQQCLGFADGSKKIPLNTALKFDIGSVSKEFNGTAIMMLKEQGKLSTEDSLSKYFPELADWARQVKIKYLLNYTSGIPLVTADSDPEIYAALKLLKTLAYAPGTGYLYNYADVYLQRRIIEKASGMPYADFLRKYIFQPAGMKETLVDYPVDGAGMAHAFDQAGHNTPYNTTMTGWVRLPAGDLYKWTQALHGNKLISAASLQELSAAFATGESSLGTTGWEDGRLVWHQHQGSNANYEALLYSRLPDDVTIIMMTNNQQMKVIELRGTLMNLLHGEPVEVPRKSLYLEIRDKVLANADSGLAYYQHLKTNEQDNYDFHFEIGDLISTGKYIGRRAHTDDAIRVYRLAVSLPAKPVDVSYGYELIGQCYQSRGDRDNALANYRKALEIYPGNKNAAGMIAALNTKP